MSFAGAAAKALPWLEFWGKVLPAVQEAVQALYRRHDGNPDAAVAELRKVKDQWGDTDAENAEFRARLDAIEDKPAGEPDEKVPEERQPYEPETNETEPG
jgi:hypothetical protein